MNDHANRAIFEACVSECWRIEQILHLGAMLGDPGISPALLQMLGGWQIDEIRPALGLPEDAPNWHVRQITEWLRAKPKLGFLIQVSTPVKIYSDTTTCYSSWSRRRTEWIYDEDFQQITAHARAWVHRMDQEFRNTLHGHTMSRIAPDLATMPAVSCGAR